MEIPTNMHLLTFFAACVLLTTTEGATSIQNCPDGSLDVVQNTEGVLNCVGYSVAEITWEFKSGQSSFSTIGRCTNSSSCDLESTYDGIFTLTPTSGTSSDLTLTTTFTAGLKSATFACDGVNCLVSIVEQPPTTTPEPTTTTTAPTEMTTETTATTTKDTPTETSLTVLNNSTTPVSTQSPTTTEGQNATDRNESQHKYVAAYVGAGFAALVVIIVVVAIVVLRMRSSKNKARTMTDGQATNGATSARVRAVPREDTRM